MFILFLLLTARGYSQTSGSEEAPSTEKNNRVETIREHLLQQQKENDKANGVLRLPKSLPRSVPPQKANPSDNNRMPVKRYKLKGEFLHNNGKGSDVYAVKPDNMPCLVPDSTFRPRTPVAAKGNKVQEKEKEGSGN
jgi:hemolysin activation/secretion protein